MLLQASIVLYIVLYTVLDYVFCIITVIMIMLILYYFCIVLLLYIISCILYYIMYCTINSTPKREYSFTPCDPF